ncbi:acyltransferase [Pendulispora brunnea]|uniref:Acyltransferase n=1 Tax=Pendulispora brunnea TaxID=2905690 RepID=A0ABZ2KHE4_9BACT
MAHASTFAEARPKQLPSLTGLRFLSALLVFIFHVSCTTPAWTFLASKSQLHLFGSVVAECGRIGVAFFFVLSGFVLTWSSRPVSNIFVFWWRRLLKIYPNHIATWLVAMLFVGGSAAAPVTWMANLLLLHAWVPRYESFLSINIPSWSLCSEAFFYFLFPFLLPLVKKIPENRLWLGLFAMGAAVFAIAVIGSHCLPVNPPLPEASPAGVWQFWFVYFLPVTRTLEFVMGIVVARIVMSGRWIRLGLRGAALLAGASYVVASLSPWLYSLAAVTVIPLSLLIAAAATADIERRTAFLSHPFIVRLGELSFAFYMVHGLVLTGVRMLLGRDAYFGAAANVAIIGAELVASLFGAWLLHSLVERPMMRLGTPTPPLIGHGVIPESQRQPQLSGGHGS